MFTIWAKIIKKEKIVRDLLYKSTQKFSQNDLHAHLMEICYQLDIPTPVVLKSHKHNFSHFNIAKFRSDDFVEKVDFDVLQIEFVSE